MVTENTQITKLKFRIKASFLERRHEDNLAINVMKMNFYNRKK